MNISQYQFSLLAMMKKFGPAISSSEIENREIALRELVMAGYSTMIRTDNGQIGYAITSEGRVYLDATNVQ